MKWFKHDAHAMRKAGLERIIMEFGIDGYGLYWACLEMIAGDLTIENLNFELGHDAELIAYKFKMDTLRVEKIMHRCVELGLFDLADSGKLRCLSLAQMVDDTMSRNPEIRKIKDGAAVILRKNGMKTKEEREKEPFPAQTSENPEETSEPVRSESDQIRLDKIRLDKIRKEKDKEDLKIQEELAFNKFWELYDKKAGKQETRKQFGKIDPSLFLIILDHVREYVKSKPDKQFRLDPERYLKREKWNDEIIQPEQKQTGFIATAEDLTPEETNELFGVEPDPSRLLEGGGES